MATKLDEFRRGVCAASARLTAFHVVDLHREDAVGLTIGKRLEQHVLDDAEDGGCGSYAETQGARIAIATKPGCFRKPRRQ